MVKYIVWFFVCAFGRISFYPMGLRRGGSYSFSPSRLIRKGIMDKLELLSIVKQSKSKTTMANAFRRALGIEEYPVKPRRRKRVKG